VSPPSPVTPHPINPVIQAPKRSPNMRDAAEGMTYSAMGLGLTVHYSAVGLGLTVRYSAVGLWLTTVSLGASARPMA